MYLHISPAEPLSLSADVHPEELFLSTRRPETLSALQMKGVHCGFDNAKVCVNKGFHLTYMYATESLCLQNLKHWVILSDSELTRSQTYT